MLDFLNDLRERYQNSRFHEKVRGCMNYMHHHVILRKKITLGCLVALWLTILVTGLISNQRRQFTRQELATAQTFENGSGEIKLVSQTYSADNHLILLRFKTKDNLSDTGTGIDPKNLKWNLYVKNKRSAMTMDIIPVIDQEITVVLRNVQPKFQALAISITNKTANTEDINPSISSESANEKSKKESNNVQFIIVENSDKLKQKYIKNSSREELTLELIDKEISKQKSEKRRLGGVIEELKNSIATDERNINSLKTQGKYMTGQQLADNEDNIETLKNSIQEKKQQIQTAEQSIDELDQRVALLIQKKFDVEHGKFDFDSSKKTYKME